MDREKVICRCFRVTAGDIADAYANGAKTFEDIQNETSCGLGCGTCEDDALEVIKELENN